MFVLNLYLYLIKQYLNFIQNRIYIHLQEKPTFHPTLHNLMIQQQMLSPGCLQAVHFAGHGRAFVCSNKGLADTAPSMHTQKRISNTALPTAKRCYIVAKAILQHTVGMSSNT